MAQVLAVSSVEIDETCTGTRWSAGDLDALAALIAIVAMGQATHAARIISALEPLAPAFTHEALKQHAKKLLSIRVGTSAQVAASRYHRDGLIFEIISWAAARQSSTGRVLLRDPHVSSTSQGLDGLMLELDKSHSHVLRTTILEDKCSEDPRAMFRDEIMRAFLDHHENRKSTELVATAAHLLASIGLSGTIATIAAAAVLDLKCRAYRGALAITTADDSIERRKVLFRDFDGLKGIAADQRVGATLVTSDDLRKWFEEVARRSVAYIDGLS